MDKNVTPLAELISVSEAPAIDDVVETKLNVPEPFVPRTCPFEPSDDGKVSVKLLPTESGAFSATKLEPLSESSINDKDAPAVAPLPTLKLAGVAVEPASISV